MTTAVSAETVSPARLIAGGVVVLVGALVAILTHGRCWGRPHYTSKTPAGFTPPHKGKKLEFGFMDLK